MSILLLGGRFLLGLSLSGLCLVLGSFVGLDSLAGGGTIGWGSIRVSSWDITLGQHLESNVLELLSLVNEILCLLSGSSLGSGLLDVLDLLLCGSLEVPGVGFEVGDLLGWSDSCVLGLEGGSDASSAEKSEEREFHVSMIFDYIL